MDDRERYAGFAIPRRETHPAKEEPSYTQVSDRNTAFFSSGEFAEIEYESGSVSIKTGEKERRTFTLVPASQLIGKMTIDPVKQKFHEMRDLAAEDPFNRDDAELFYKQAKFMEDFTDDYDGNEQVSMYYPCYQRMGYEQLRTYFTWRTKVRRGEIQPASLSYIFLYIYELLSGIGVDNPEDGLDKLITIWNFFREREPGLDKYLPRWLKDYYIYYNLPQSFPDFVNKYGIREYYNDLFLFDSGSDNSLLIWNGISAYDVTQSKFYNAGNEALLNDCFSAVISGVREFCAGKNVRIENLLVYGVSKGIFWRPFGQALFYHWFRQPDRQVEIPGGDKYFCDNNRWTANVLIYHSDRKDFVGYLIKKTEACLRQTVKYKSKLTVNPNIINMFALRHKELGIALEELDIVIEKAVADFYKNKNRTVVTVDYSNLARIREEALGTQDKLIVPEDETLPMTAVRPVDEPTSQTMSPQVESVTPVSDGWAGLYNALSVVERKALLIALQNSAGIKAFSDENGIMLEVLADSINEKAADHIGDNILELNDVMVIYDEYMEKVAEMVG